MLYNIIKSFYISGEENHSCNDDRDEDEHMWKYPAFVESKRKFFEELEKSEKERLERDKNANWPFRYKRRILSRKGGLNGLEEEFVWLRYRIILLIRKIW